jgi:hypothetical protein
MTKEQQIVKQAQLRELMLKDCQYRNKSGCGHECPTCKLFESRTRAKIKEDYHVGGGLSGEGVIHSPGKFEGEMLYVPYFWEKAMEGFADRDDGKVYQFDIQPVERKMFPELGTKRRTVKLIEREDGFVCEL